MSDLGCSGARILFDRRGFVGAVDGPPVVNSAPDTCFKGLMRKIPSSVGVDWFPGIFHSHLEQTKS